MVRRKKYAFRKLLRYVSQIRNRRLDDAKLSMRIRGNALYLRWTSALSLFFFLDRPYMYQENFVVDLCDCSMIQTVYLILPCVYSYCLVYTHTSLLYRSGLLIASCFLCLCTASKHCSTWATKQAARQKNGAEQMCITMSIDRCMCCAHGNGGG